MDYKVVCCITDLLPHEAMDRVKEQYPEEYVIFTVCLEKTRWRTSFGVNKTTSVWWPKPGAIEAVFIFPGYEKYIDKLHGIIPSERVYQIKEN